MIDETLSTRMSLLATKAELNAYKISLKAFEVLPAKEAAAMVREWLERCEDMEISLERKLEPVTPLHSAVL